MQHGWDASSELKGQKPYCPARLFSLTFYCSNALSSMEAFRLSMIRPEFAGSAEVRNMQVPSRAGGRRAQPQTPAVCCCSASRLRLFRQPTPRPCIAYSLARRRITVLVRPHWGVLISSTPSTVVRHYSLLCVNVELPRHTERRPLAA